MIDALGPDTRERRLVGAILVLGTIVLFFAAVSMAATAIGYFGDLFLTFFLAWLLAFIISPVVTRIVAVIPRLPRVLATVLVYSAIVALLVFLVLLVAQALSTSITQLVASLPQIRGDIDAIVGPAAGLARRHRPGPGRPGRPGPGGPRQPRRRSPAQLIVPLQSIAVASVGAIGTMLIVFILSIYMVIDRDAILAFLYRLVPPSYAEEARLLQNSVARSFGGFLRGQARHGHRVLPHRAGDEPAARPAARGPDLERRRGPDGDPVLRPVPGLGPARHRGDHLQAGGRGARRSC